MRNPARAILRRIRLVYRRWFADHVDALLALGDSDEFTKIWNEVSPVLHWDHRPSARRLYELVRATAGVEGTVVEIGSYLGNSTIYLARAGATVHAVDPHTEDSMVQLSGDPSASERFLANLERFGVRDRVVYRRLPSVQAARSWTGGPIRLLYVDGMHTFDAVLADYESWQPHLANEHVVVFDDVLWKEVERAVRLLRARHRPPYFYVRGGQAIFSTRRLPLRVAGLP